MARPRAGEPDRRAHRLQRGLRAPVRARPGGQGRGVPARRRLARAALTPGPRRAGHGRGEQARPGLTRGLGGVPGGRRLGAARGRLSGDRGQHRHRRRPRARRRAVVLRRAGVRDRARAQRAVRAERAAGRACGAGPPRGERVRRACRAGSWTSPRRCCAGPVTPCCWTAAAGSPATCRSTSRRPGWSCSSSTPGSGTPCRTGGTRNAGVPCERGGPRARRTVAAGRNGQSRVGRAARRPPAAAPGPARGHRERTGSRRGPAAARGPARPVRPAADRVACLAPRRLRGLLAAGRRHGRGGGRGRGARGPDDRRRVRRVGDRADRGPAGGPGSWPASPPRTPGGAGRRRASSTRSPRPPPGACADPPSRPGRIGQRPLPDRDSIFP